MKFRNVKNRVLHTVVDLPVSGAATLGRSVSAESREMRKLELAGAKQARKILKAQKAEERKQDAERLAEKRAELRLIAAERIRAAATEELVRLEAKRVLANKETAVPAASMPAPSPSPSRSNNSVSSPSKGAGKPASPPSGTARKSSSTTKKTT